MQAVYSEASVQWPERPALPSQPEKHGTEIYIERHTGSSCSTTRWPLFASNTLTPTHAVCSSFYFLLLDSTGCLSAPRCVSVSWPTSFVQLLIVRRAKWHMGVSNIPYIRRKTYCMFWIPIQRCDLSPSPSGVRLRSEHTRHTSLLIDNLEHNRSACLFFPPQIKHGVTGFIMRPVQISHFSPS